MSFTPWDWQEADQEYLAASNYVTLAAIETGGGKSALGAFAIKNSGAETTLIIAPESTHESAWIPTVEAVTGITPRVLHNRNKAGKAAFADFEWQQPGVYLITPQLFTRSDVSQWAGDLVLVDEIHLLGNPGKQGQRKLSGYDRRDDPINQRFPMRIALSGTPFRNKFENSWSVMRFLWPELNKSGEIAYENHYMWKYQRMTNKEIVTGRDAEGNLTRAKEWLTEREPGLLISQAPSVIQHFRRRKCCEYHPQGFLPVAEPTVTYKSYDLTAKQKTAMKQLEEMNLAWLDEHPLVTEFPFTKLLRMRQLVLGEPTVTWTEEVNDEGELEKVMHLDFDLDCKSPALDKLFEILEMLDEGEPVVVYMESQKFARVVTHRLNAAGYSAFEFSGRVPKKERAENFKNFGKPGGHQVLVGVLSSFATGTDGAQRVSSTEIWLERSLDVTTNTQAEARLDRMGGAKQVQRFLVQDSEGFSAGRLGKEIERRLEIRRTTERKI